MNTLEDLINMISKDDIKDIFDTISHLTKVKNCVETYRISCDYCSCSFKRSGSEDIDNSKVFNWINENFPMKSFSSIEDETSARYYDVKELVVYLKNEESSNCNICPFKDICKLIDVTFCGYDEADDIINYLCDKWIEENPEPVLKEIKYWTDFKDEEDYRKSVDYLTRNGYKHESFSIDPNSYKEGKILSFTEGSKFVYYRFTIPEDSKNVKYIKDPQLFREYIPEHEKQLKDEEENINFSPRTWEKISEDIKNQIEKETLNTKPKKNYKGFILGFMLGGALVYKLKG